MTDHSRNQGRTDTGRRSFIKGATTTLLAAGTVGTSGTAAAGNQPGAYHASSRRIPSWDGTELATTLYVPDGEGPFPAVLMTHGFGGDRGSGLPFRMAPKYAERGYAVLTYDSRGFGESGGEVGVGGPREVRDAQALIDWLAAATHEGAPLVETDAAGDPAVGMDGLSYAGSIQLNVAAADDRLDAIVPRWAWNDLTYSLSPNGALKLGWAALLMEFGIAGSRGLQSGDNRPDRRDIRAGLSPRLYEILAEAAVRNNLAPRHRAFFKLRSPTIKGDGLSENAPPALLIQGWNDTLFTPTEAVRNHDLLEAGGTDARLVFVRGGHSLEQQAVSEQAQVDGMAMDWMDEHVADRDPSGLPEVTYWQGQKGSFASAEALPTAGDGASLSLADASNAGEGTTTLAGGPAPTSTSELLFVGQDDYAPATSAEFDFRVLEATELLGVPELTLDVMPLGRDPLVFAKLWHVTDDGADLIYNQASAVQVEGAVGEAQAVTFDLAGLERTLEAGDELRLTLATTDASYSNARTGAGVRIGHADSELRLPVASGDGLGVAVDVTRSDDGAVFTGGGTNQVDLAVDADTEVFVRDRTPKGWTVVAGDPHDRTAPPETDGNYVEFTDATDAGTRSYFAEAPSGPRESGRETFGPAAFSLDGETWFTVPGTTDENAVFGASTSG